MVQFYLLLIVSNVLASLEVLADKPNEKLPVLQEFRGFLDKRRASRLILGLSAGISGLLKFISVTSGDVVVVGDLLPALVGIFLGLISYTGFFKQRSEVLPGLMDKLDKIRAKWGKAIGYGGLLITLLHFLFPGVLFL